MTATAHRSTTSERPWILGLEQSPRSLGAMEFARWLRETLRDRVLGVNVSELWLAGVPPGEGVAYQLAMRSETERWLETLDAGAPRSPVDAAKIVDEVDAETGLARASRGAPGVIVGRRTRSEGAVVRLGRVARRLLRVAPAPVIVVPPERALCEFHGPVVLASDFTPASEAAARFAAAFAERLGRPLLCMHVAQSRGDESFVRPEPRWDDLRRAYHASVLDKARGWARVHCPGHDLIVEFGDPVERLTAVANQRDACLLVVGSRRPGLLERFFVGSTSSALAATAGCAVAVVPGDAPSDAA